MDSLESTPFNLNGRAFVQMAKMGPFPPDGLGHSYFCVYDISTGEEMSCPAGSSGYAFQSSIVDDARGVVWVFGSAWDRAQSSAPDCKPWGCGACAQGHCNVSVMSSTDAIHWEGPFVAVSLPANVTVPNVAVGFRPPANPPAGLPSHQAFMILESSVSVAVNVGTDGDLAANWLLLNSSVFGVSGGTGEAGGCPAARYNPADEFYYVMGGGNYVDVARSRNLTRNSWELTPLGPVEAGCVRGFENCSLGTDIARIAPGYFEGYWANGSDRGHRVFLDNLTAWNWAANDVDFNDVGGAGPTTFIYGFCAQTKPANATGNFGDGYMLGTSPLSAVEWLASFFPPA